MERAEIRKIIRPAATELERRDILVAFLVRRGFEISDADDRIYVWL